MSFHKFCTLVKAKSLLMFFFQVMSFLLLGPIFVEFFFRLLKNSISLPQNIIESLAFWEDLFATLLGFGLSLMIDWHRAPLKSCLPLRWFRRKTTGIYIPNNTFFNQPSNFLAVPVSRKRSPLFWSGLSLIGGIIGIFCNGLLVLILNSLFPNTTILQKDIIHDIFENNSNFQSFLLLVVSPVIFEELIYRGRGFSLLARYWGGRNAVVFSSLLFAFSHVGPIEIVALLPLSFFSGWLRWRSGNLAFPMLVHLGNNLIVFLARYV